MLLNIDPGLYSELFKYYVRQQTGNQFIQDDYTLGFEEAAQEMIASLNAKLQELKSSQ
ncbi:hypothetical protein IDH44_25325 [Paenibacillus sp. IB182496]|uniref:Uncharacterized protein n=1 Tax=Paenibacillus sabuli TaxID=2772509 RepID=A0A927BZM5_9BACL|nr:hypothetical protein [Paenibacillus sabuli]MBD2848515.1 hypothetical protein [Paenibacillus sabuli]